MAPPAGLNAEQRIWVVDVQGSFIPAFGYAHEPAFHWGVIVLDANSGKTLATYAGLDGNDAAYFASLPDHGSES
jgi:hypothetical protein